MVSLFRAGRQLNEAKVRDRGDSQPDGDASRTPAGGSASRSWDACARGPPPSPELLYGRFLSLATACPLRTQIAAVWVVRVAGLSEGGWGPLCPELGGGLSWVRPGLTATRHFSELQTNI